MQTSTPIADLYAALGREPTDRVSLSFFNDTTTWQTRQIQVRFADAAAAVWTKEKLNVYLMVNTVDPSTTFTNGRGNAAQVNRLTALWADIDYKDGGLPREKATLLVSQLSAIVNAQPVAIVHSGHGMQPYWAIEDGEIGVGTRSHIAGILTRWGQLVKRLANIEGGNVDSVYDLPRVLRAPGTINFKDAGEPVATSLEISEWSRPLTLREVDEALDSYGFTETHLAEEEFIIRSHPSTWVPAEHDCRWSEQLAAEINAGTKGARHPWMLGKAYKIEVAARNGCITAETWAALVRLLDARFRELLETGDSPRTAAPREVESAMTFARGQVSSFDDFKMASNLNYHTHKDYLEAVELPKESSSTSAEVAFAEPAPTAIDATPEPTEQVSTYAPPLVKEMVPIALATESFNFTDAANAERLAERVMGLYIFVPGLGWHVWDGGRYVPDLAMSITRQAVSCVREFAENNPTAQSWAQRSMAAPRIAAAIGMAESIPEIVTMPMDLDAKPLELCTPGGVVELSQGTLRAPVPVRDRHTRQTNVTPDSTIPTPKWNAFLETVLTDPERIRYLQYVCGVILIGEVRWHVLPVLVGVGANGKSALLNILSGILGDYAATMPENFLLDTGKLEHSTEIARLRGVRLAIASETKPGGKFNESRVKMLTGERTLTGRAMRKDFMDFPATHTLVLALNHLPQVRSGGDSFWRRLVLLEFKYQIPEELRNEGLSEEIINEEGAGVLAWMIEGALMVQRDGLIAPPTIVNATAYYRDEEDHINAYCSDRVEANPTSAFAAADIYNSYVAWCKKNGHDPLTQTALIRELRQKFPMVPTKVGRQRGWRGLYIYVNED